MLKRVLGFFTLVGLLGVFALTMGFLWWKSREVPETFDTVAVANRDVVLKTVATGAIVPRVEVDIKSRVSGVVSEVSDVAATKEGMTSALKNEQLVAKLSGEGAPIAVKVLLDEDSTTASGLNWSSSKGPAQRIPAGTLLDGAIVVERVAILTLLAPSLDRLLGMTER